MGRAPTYKLRVFSQVTLRDVYARVAGFDLDVDAFIAATLQDPSGDRDVDFVEAFTWKELGTADVSDVWKKLAANPWQLAHPANELWTGLRQMTRKMPAYRNNEFLQPDSVRTLPTTLQKTGWDYRRMPSDTLGAATTLKELVDKLDEKLRPTIGGEEYLGDDDVSPARAVTVLATTLATVLLDEAATISDDRLHARILRPDIYEQAVEGAKLGDHFQIIRRLLELHHHEHLRVPINGPGSEERDFGFIEYRGRDNQYLQLNRAAAKRWVDPALYR